MSSLNCTVIAANPAHGIVPGVVTSLGRILGLHVDAPRTFSNEPSQWHEADGVVVVSDRDSHRLGLRQIEQIRGAMPRCSVVAVGDGLDEDQMLSLLAAGAYDFVSVPCREGEIEARVRRAFGLAPSPAPRAAPAFADVRLRDLVGSSPAFRRQIAKLPMIAGNDSGVLILGETGTCKELFAQAVHYFSERAARPWVAVNCAAIPSDLVEAELFGHVKGAYTTACAARKGLVAEAEGGTLFLDEIDGLPYGAQAKLLRFLQEKEFRSVGSNAVCHADVRVIAASNAGLAELAAKGSFRRDLFFRLNVLGITLPPLRERQDDVLVLARHFLEHFARQFKRTVTGISPPALHRLAAYDWPGNVRELRHVIERAVLLSTGPMLGVDDLELGEEEPEEDGACAALDDQSFHAAKARIVQDFERGFIENLLASCHGNVTQAARLAKKNRRAFFELIRKHEIDASRFR